MIVTVGLGASIEGLFDYLRSDRRYDAPPEQPGAIGGRVRGIETRNLGIEELDLAPTEMVSRTARAMRAIIDGRPDMIYRIAHLAVSPEPTQAISRGPARNRTDCLHTLR
ncbi:MAG: hypothetical protein HQL38_15780, partial [Alphaproteobacteria bacterium]|nr:hypothetical protein [Alphaproteobacteria bacterium]